MLSSNSKSRDNKTIHEQSSSEIKQKEYGGSKGPEPTRYGDWEKNGRVSDF
jgi:hypothetical protein